MALLPRYRGDDWLQVVQVVVVDLVQSGFSDCTLLAAGFSRGRKRVIAYSIQWLKRLKPASFRQDLIALFDLLQQQKIKPLIARRFPLAEAREAHELLGQGGVTGKIVLVRNASSLDSGAA
jgi:NADPH:quinone reductase-like Zn-dependent oxidoreductase